MTYYNPKTQEVATRHVGDVAETVTGQLSYCIHMINAYQETINTASDEDAIRWLTEVFDRIGVAQKNVLSMIEAYSQEMRYRRRDPRTEKLHRRRERVR